MKRVAVLFALLCVAAVALCFAVMHAREYKGAMVSRIQADNAKAHTEFLQNEFDRIIRAGREGNQ
jgi:hypothetical protein